MTAQPSSSAIDHIRAPLFVPGTRPERFGKAIASGADAVILDLEDAVASTEKHAAREILQQEVPQLDSRRCPIGIRTNSAATEHVREDVALVAVLLRHLDFVVLPEVQNAEDVQYLQRLISEAAPEKHDQTLPILALIESSAGVLNAPAIAASENVRRLALGAADLSEEWEVEPSDDETEFDIARQHLVLASRAAGLDGPIDSPHMNVRDPDGLASRVGAIRKLGMKGKLCIHPHQVATVRSSFVVSEQEYRRLTELVEVFEEAEQAGNSSIRLESGGFVDYPVYRRALKKIQEYRTLHH